jgi:hypothetical protein
MTTENCLDWKRPQGDLQRKVKMADNAAVTILYRPVGQKELNLIRDSGWRCFPPRLEWQPIFYPVLSEDYAIRIARDWNTKDEQSGFVGYVLRFAVQWEYISRFQPRNAGGKELLEYWIPADELETFNENLIGRIELIHEFKPDAGQTPERPAWSAVGATKRKN